MVDTSNGLIVDALQRKAITGMLRTNGSESSLNYGFSKTHVRTLNL